VEVKAKGVEDIAGDFLEKKRSGTCERKAKMQ